MHLRTFAVVLALAPLAAAAQPACTCSGVLEGYAAWVEGNYVGYAMEVRETGDGGAYARRLTEYRRRAMRTPLARCRDLVDEWLGYFGDPHLAARRQRSDSLRMARGVPESLGTRSVTELAQRARRATRDAVEGVWRSGDERIVIAEEPMLRGVFVAVPVQKNSLGASGAIVARLEEATERGVYTMRGAGPLADHRRASLHRDGAMLWLGANAWTRGAALADPDATPTHPTDPLHPLVRVIADDAVLIVLPSHLPQYRAPLDSLLHVHRDALGSAPIVLIDVRGSQGGSGDTARPLAPFYFSEALAETPPPNRSSWVMASPYNRAVVRYLRSAMGGDDAHVWIRETAARLEAAEDGELVRDAFDRVEPFRPDSVNAATRAVGILTDWINLSAVDAFLHEAKQSERVVQFGEATQSAIDYQSAWTVALGEPAECASEGFQVIYPRSASPWMPFAPINPAGFVPDVPLGTDEGPWVRAALRDLRGRLATE